jgi:hypothetical protein
MLSGCYPNRRRLRVCGNLRHDHSFNISPHCYPNWLVFLDVQEKKERRNVATALELRIRERFNIRVDSWMILMISILTLSSFQYLWLHLNCYHRLFAWSIQEKEQDSSHFRHQAQHYDAMVTKMIRTHSSLTIMIIAPIAPIASIE